MIKNCIVCGKEFEARKKHQICCNNVCGMIRRRNLMKSYHEGRTGKPSGTSTLCWDCEKSVTEECSWSKSFKPVEGWEAISTTVRMGGVDEPSYCVVSCPEFKRG